MSQKNAKELNPEYIEIQDEHLEGNKKSGNYWFRRFKYLGKLYIQMTKNKKAINSEYVIYYCHFHRTLIKSTKLSKNGEKKRHNKCNSRVFYYKYSKKYICDWPHSTFCDKSNLPQYENLGDIAKEIDKYDDFKKDIIYYLESNPLIKYSDYKKKALSYYYKNNCSFIIKENTFKNLYYNWRRNSNQFKKYSIFTNNKTFDGRDFLKDYTFTYLYTTNGKTRFLHEHMIFCSDYFIKKLRSATHWYIDSTFVIPPTFKQLLVILYLDNNNNKRYPGLFGLLNNKKKAGYNYFFKKVIDIITIDKTKDLDIITYSTDFEDALVDTLKELFPNKRGVGCYFHYTKNLLKNAKSLSLYSKELNETTKECLKQLYKIPFIINDKKINYVNELFSVFIKKNKKYEEFKNYLTFLIIIHKF